jgi:LytS/YehU family sensor histidine kinase
VRIENTCDVDAIPVRRGGLGLANVRRRLEARYGKEADMRVTNDTGVFRVQLSMPFEVLPVATVPESLQEETAQ